MLSLVVSLGLVGQLYGRPLAPPSPCITAADSAESMRARFELLVTRMDSVRLAQIGLAYRPTAGVQVVNDPQICQAGVQAHNALYPDSHHHITRAVILQVGTDRYLLWAVKQRSGRGRDLTFVFDLGWRLIDLLV